MPGYNLESLRPRASDVADHDTLSECGLSGRRGLLRGRRAPRPGAQQLIYRVHDTSNAFSTCATSRELFTQVQAHGL